MPGVLTVALWVWVLLGLWVSWDSGFVFCRLMVRLCFGFDLFTWFDNLVLPWMVVYCMRFPVVGMGVEGLVF